MTKQTTMKLGDRVEIEYDVNEGVPVVDTSNKGTVIVTLMRKA